MRNIKYGAAAGFALFILAPLAFANAQSVSIQSLSPGTSVFAKNNLTFTIVPVGFSVPFYQLSDSFAGSTASASDISGSGSFSWAPAATDVGVHTFTITITDNAGDTANTTQMITVLPPPSVSIGSPSPSGNVMPGTKLTFTVSTPGFTSPSFIVGDGFSGSTLSDANINSSGNFSWTPDLSQDGTHIITIYASDSLGHSASANVQIQVGAGPTLTVQQLSPGASVQPGQPVSFTVGAVNFSPTAFSVSDSISGSTLSNLAINSSGAFLWTPAASDVGVHVITVTGQIGAYGPLATTTQTITVLGPGGVVPPAPASTPGATSTNPTLTALQAQLAQLQAQLAGQSGSASTSSGVTFTASLQQGSTGAQVNALQTVLIQLGFLSGAPTGYYGALTTAAVKAFQAAHGLPKLGIVGPSTRAALNVLASGSASASMSTGAQTSASASGSGMFQNAIAYGESGPDALALQKKLASLGFFSGTASGYFGPATLEALVAFQIAHQIPLVDQLGDATRAALNQ